MKSTVTAKLERQMVALSAERKRLQAIDDAEKAARAEREQEKVRLEKERERVKKERDAMIEWELYQPPPPPQVTITGMTEPAEEGELPKAITEDGGELPIPAEKVDVLKEMLASLAGMEPPKRVVASHIAEAKVDESGEAPE